MSLKLSVIHNRLLNNLYILRLSQLVQNGHVEMSTRIEYHVL